MDDSAVHRCWQPHKRPGAQKRTRPLPGRRRFLMNAALYLLFSSASWTQTFFFLFVCFTLRADKYRDSSSAGELLPNSSCVVFRFNFTHLIYIFHIFISNLWTCIKTKTTCLCIQSRLIRYPLTFYDKEGKQVQFYRPNPDHVFSMDTGWKNVFIHDIWRQLDLEALLSTKHGAKHPVVYFCTAHFHIWRKLKLKSVFFSSDRQGVGSPEAWIAVQMFKLPSLSQTQILVRKLL